MGIGKYRSWGRMGVLAGYLILGIILYEQLEGLESYHILFILFTVQLLQMADIHCSYG